MIAPQKFGETLVGIELLPDMGGNAADAALWLYISLCVYFMKLYVDTFWIDKAEEAIECFEESLRKEVNNESIKIRKGE